MLTFGSLFAGIGGIDLGLERAGMRCQWQVEIDARARSVLTRRWPDVPKYADIRDCGAHNLEHVDLICGGFPCQDLSVAGNRAGLAGSRSGLFYELTRIADELRPAFLLWENVPGLLSSRDGRDFLAVLVELERIGYCGCWTVLDAQFFGLAQRRQRVFGLFARASIGAQRCAEILSLAARLPWNTQAGRAKREGVASSITRSAGHHGYSSPRGDGSDNLISFNPDSYGQDAAAASVGETLAAAHGVAVIKGAAIGRAPENGPQRGEVLDDGTVYTLNATEVHAVAFAWHRAQLSVSDGDTSLTDSCAHPPAVAAPRVAATYDRGDGADNLLIAQFDGHSANAIQGVERVGVANTLDADGRDGVAVASNRDGIGIRRLTPRECERLQGFPDDWTEGQPDSARYRQLGNAVAVPCAEWIGRRIVESEACHAS